MSGTGKSTAVGMLGARGHRTVDTDSDEWSHWGEAAGRVGRLDMARRRHGRATSRARSRQPLRSRLQEETRASSTHSSIVLRCWSAPVDVLLARIAVRTNNSYGKLAAERAMILHYLDVVEPRLRATATVEIDASAPIATVVRRLEELV